MRETLIVVDMQNDFVYGPLSNPDTKAVVPAIKNKIKEGYNFIKSEFPETKKEIEKITIYDRKEETKSSLQYNKNYDYLNKKYNNNIL